MILLPLGRIPGCSVRPLSNAVVRVSKFRREVGEVVEGTFRRKIEGDGAAADVAADDPELMVLSRGRTRGMSNDEICVFLSASVWALWRLGSGVVGVTEVAASRSEREAALMFLTESRVDSGLDAVDRVLLGAAVLQ